MSLKFKTIGLVSILLFILSWFYLVPNRLTMTDNLRLTETLRMDKWEMVSDMSGIFDYPAYTDVFFFDVNNGVTLLSGVGGERTKDGGKTWENISDFDNIGTSSLIFINSEIWVVGANIANKKDRPVILKSNDKGEHWKRQNFDLKSLKQVNKEFSYFDDICFDKNGKSWIVGDGGILEAKFENNKFKISRIFETKEKLYHLLCEDSGKIWAYGDNGVIAYYNQLQWNYQKMGEDKVFTKMLIATDSMWLVGSSRKTSQRFLLKSKDNGLTWEDKTPTSADGVTDIYLEKNVGWVIGFNGNIFKTLDGGETWEKEQSPTEKGLLSIFFLNSENGWIVGDSGIVLRYKN